VTAREQQEIITVLKALREAGHLTRGKPLQRRVTRILHPGTPWERRPEKVLPFDVAWADLAQYAQRYLQRWGPVPASARRRWQKLQQITVARGATPSEAATAARLAKRLTR